MTTLSEQAKQFGTSANSSPHLSEQHKRGDPSTMTRAGADGYGKGYACGFSQGTYSKMTNGPTEPPWIPSYVECGLPTFRWLVTETSIDDGRDYTVDRTASAYPQWSAGFSIGYMDGWYDGRAVSATGGGAWLPPDDSGVYADPNTEEPAFDPGQEPDPWGYYPSVDSVDRLRPVGDGRYHLEEAQPEVDTAGRLRPIGSGRFHLPEGGLESKPQPAESESKGSTGKWVAGIAAVLAVGGIAWWIAADKPND
jgi:hypothetical protein